MKQRARGFTLLEVAIAIALMAIVIGTCTVIMAQVLSGNRRAQVHSEIMRDATLASGLLNSELRQAGLGVPPSFNNICNPDGFHIRRTCSSGIGCTPLYGTAPGGGAFANNDNALNFYAAVIVAADAQVGIVGDVPRPDAQYSAYGPLHNRFTGGSDGTSSQGLMWHNEGNGGCAPGNTCNLQDTSTFFLDTTGSQVCSTANPNARTCPWGMRRVVPGERLQIIAGDLTWSHAELDTGPTVFTIPTTTRLAVQLNPGFDLNKSDPNFASDGVWANRQQGDGPGGIFGVGWVTTLDRVFFFHDTATRTLRRVQCFGDPDPNHAAWPNAAAAAMPALASLPLTPQTAGGVPVEANTCIGPDIIARNVESVRFTYFNAGGTALAAPVTGVNPPTCPSPNTVVAPVAGKSAVRRIDYDIQFKKSVDNIASHDVTHNIRGSIRLQNL